MNPNQQQALPHGGGVPLPANFGQPNAPVPRAQQQQQQPAFTPHQTGFNDAGANVILCCQCGAPIPSNPLNTCVDCLRADVDITQNIPKSTNMFHCRNCDRYLSPPSQWTVADLESKELLALCIKRVKPQMHDVRLVDASFIWTEPHSKRLKVKLTIQKEVFAKAVLEQSFVVEYVVQNQMCDMCHRSEAQDSWNAVVQVRQKVVHKKTFYYLEQMILKHNAQKACINIREQHDGIDFFFKAKNEAIKFADFISQMVPVRQRKSERLISADVKSNTANFKFTFSVEIAPVCKDDLVCLPIKLARMLGNISQLVVINHISSNIHVIDPYTLQTAEISTMNYWRHPFTALTSPKALIEITVLDQDRLGMTRGKFALSEVEVARSRDLGSNDNRYVIRTHLANILQPGDTVLGVDLENTNLNDESAERLGQQGQLPPLVLIRKVHEKRNKKRAWKLRRLAVKAGQSRDVSRRNSVKSDADEDYEEFLRDLEADKEYRQDINMYRRDGVNPQDAHDGGVSLDELIDDMNLDDE
eukprot:Clim_evm1s49 gene=Clim_evmTU1s49